MLKLRLWVVAVCVHQSVVCMGQQSGKPGAAQVGVCDLVVGLEAAEAAQSREISRTRPIRISRDVLNEVQDGRLRQVRLSLFPDVAVVANISKVEAEGADSFTFSAELAGVQHGSMVAVVRGPIVAAAIFAPGLGMFDIRQLADGRTTVVRQIGARDPLTYCGSSQIPPGDDRGRGISCPSFNSTLHGYAADDGSTVDLMVVYTAAARDAAGGVAQIEALIDLAVSVTNNAYANSQITPRLRVIRKALINYTESGQGILDLTRLSTPNDGYLDSVHADRDTYGADLVSLWVSSFTTGEGGDAWQPFVVGPDNDGTTGFSVMREDNGPYETLAHETGHNFGCQHDRANAGNAGIFNYSYGYREPGSQWKTIMAYPPGTTITNFSNPNVNYSGPLGDPGPTGVAGNDPDTSCNNALTINQMAWTLANYRPSTLATPPAARLYVRPSAPPNGDGATWATAMQDLQAAMCRAAQSRGVVHEIWTAAGTYKPDRGRNDRGISFRLVNGVSVYGGFAGGETSLNQRNPNVNLCTLSGDIGAQGNNSDNTYHVIDGVDLNSTAILDGFTITGGNADGAYPHDSGGGMRTLCGGPSIVNCKFVSNSAVYGGGAVFNGDGANPSFSGCTFSGNTGAVWAGGMYSSGSGCAPTLTNCTFTANIAPRYVGMMTDAGASATLTQCTFSQHAADYGGGFACFDASMTLTGCTISGNSAVNGGGGLMAGNAVLTLNDCEISGNSAGFGGDIYWYTVTNTTTLNNCQFTSNSAPSGGGMYNYSASPQLTTCAFVQNAAGSSGGGVAGAIDNVVDSSPTVISCAFDGNSAGCCGGAVGNFGGNAAYRNCTFVGNTANFGAGAWCADSNTSSFQNCRFAGNSGNYSGGALHTTDGSTPAYVNCVFSGNRALNGYGGVAYDLTNGSPRMTNCSMAGNSAAFYGGGIYDDTSTTVLNNCVLWQNSDLNGTVESSQITHNNPASVSYCIVQGLTGGLGGSGNKGSNPLLVDVNGADNVLGTTDDDLRLSAGSPAIDAGKNAAVPVGVTKDFNGVARFHDDPATADTGLGAPPIVDIGAFEFGSTCAACDTNCDGSINQFDIQPFVEALQGQPPCSVCSADTNGDGSVNQFDIQGFVQCLGG